MQVFLIKNTKRAAAENFFNCLRPSKEHICLAINPTDLEWVTVRVCYGNSRRWKISTPQGGRKGVAIANRGQSYAGISHYIKMERLIVDDFCKCEDDHSHIPPIPFCNSYMRWTANEITGFSCYISLTIFRYIQREGAHCSLLSLKKSQFLDA